MPDFDEIYKEYRPKIKRYMARLTGEHEAEDLTQEVFVKVSRSLPGFKGESSLSTWIYKIATNTAMDRLKSPAYRQAGLETHVEEGLADDGVAALHDETPPVDSRLVKEQMSDCIRDVVDGLSPEYRTVIALSEINELKNAEIAGILGVSVDTVKIRLHRARAALKKKLEDKCSFYRDEQNEFSCEPKVTMMTFKRK